MTDTENRRPIATRKAWWSLPLAMFLVKAGIHPDQVSLASIVFAIAGAALLLGSSNDRHAVCFFIAGASCIQLRLLCNMLDGLMAVECKLQSRLGAMYNEFPDRIADVLLLIAAGYASHFAKYGIILGWSAAILALLTAYIRAFGAAQGLKQDFCGPMAKPHRMAVLTIVCLCAAVERLLHLRPLAISIGLILIVVGAVVTCVRRTCRIAAELKSTTDSD